MKYFRWRLVYMNRLQVFLAQGSFPARTAVGLTLLFVAFFTAGIPAVHAADDKDAPKISLSELHRAPLNVGPLTITIRKLRGSKFLEFRGGIEFTIENSTDQFAPFSPARLLLVDNKGRQVNLLGTLFRGREPVPATDTDIAPHARLKMNYTLTSRMELPVNIYYDKTLLATVVK